MNAITEAQVDKRKIGIYNKFDVRRTDGSDEPGGKHHGDKLFVLNITTDKFAATAALAYAKACAKEYPVLAADLRSMVRGAPFMQDTFVTVPETMLPNGLVVPEFQVAAYLTGKSEDDELVINDQATPWTDISYYDAKSTATDAGYQLITETQYLALAHNIANQDINWTGGKVGEGSLLQGLRDGEHDEAQPVSVGPDEGNERRWMQLSNGARIWDVAGNAYSWVHDDVQGNDEGLIAKPFAEDSPSITTAPAPSMKQGVGWYPSAGSDWSGDALVRGGCWSSGDRAGAFRLDLVWPDNGSDGIGFRCTK